MKILVLILKLVAWALISIVIGMVSSVIACTVRMVLFLVTPVRAVERRFKSDEQREQEIRILGNKIYAIYLLVHIYELIISPYYGMRRGLRSAFGGE